MNLLIFKCRYLTEIKMLRFLPDHGKIFAHRRWPKDHWADACDLCSSLLCFTLADECKNLCCLHLTTAYTHTHARTLHGCLNMPRFVDDLQDSFQMPFLLSFSCNHLSTEVPKYLHYTLFLAGYSSKHSTKFSNCFHAWCFSQLHHSIGFDFKY